VYYDGINLSHGDTIRIWRGKITVYTPASFRYVTISRMRAMAANSNSGNADIPYFARVCNEVSSVRNIPNLENRFRFFTPQTVWRSTVGCDCGKWSVSSPDPFTPVKEPLVTQWRLGWDPETVSIFWRREISWPDQESHHDSSLLQPVAVPL
jgi:hypothetical protein